MDQIIYLNLITGTCASFGIRCLLKSGGYRHGFTGRSAIPASRCAFLAVFHIMFIAFFSAGFAGIGANPAQLHTVVASQAHEFGSRAANRRAFEVEADTFGHHFYILFTEAGNCTMVAGDCTGQAGCYTVLKFLM
nr:hypothetical protein [Mucilaginibacter glaciei]